MSDTQSDSGLEAIREALRVRNTRGNLANLARDLGIGVGMLDGFREGRIKLPDLTLQLLCKDLFHGHLWLDIATDKLRPVMKAPPTLLGHRPENNAPIPHYTPGPSQTPNVLVREANTIPQPKRMSWLKKWL